MTEGALLPESEKAPVALGADAPLALDPEGIASLSEAVAVLDGAGGVVVASKGFWADPVLFPDGSVSPPLAALLAEGRRPAAGAWPRLRIGEGAAARLYDIVTIPLRMPGWRMVFATDRTLDVGLKNALVVSRARFKTLVEVSSDYAWETGTDGTFNMVTPKGLAGRSPRDLIGVNPATLLDPESPQVAISPFATPVPVEGAEVWVRHVDGSLICFEVAAVPLYDDQGDWRGARGVCHDITERCRQERAQAEQRNRERVFARITDVFRREIDPSDMLQVAASTSTHGFGASGCQIFGAEARPDRVVSHPRLLPVASFGIVPDPLLVGPVLDQLVGHVPPGPEIRAVAGLSLLLAPALYSGRLVGAMLLWRNPGRDPWGEGDQRLLATLSGQIAAAIEQQAAYRLLLDASRTDPLTGLLNRRAFYDEMKRRFRRQQRDTRAASLIYLDLDNFKLVNDVHGHGKGDEALRHVGDILRNNTRSTDLVARLGGDEFAVWLDAADETVAVNRAQVFLAAAQTLVVYSGRADRPLRMSIGIAVHEPRSAEDINEFVSRADMAMYKVKHGGKGTYGLAPPARARR